MSCTRDYDIGQGIVYQAIFEDPDTGARVDPSGGVTLTLTGTGLSVPLVLSSGGLLLNPSTGVYRYVRSSPVSGKLNWSFLSTGDYEGAKQGSDTIRRSQS